jgi:hypothetical protein
MTAAQILEAARELSADEQVWLVNTLQQDEFAEWQKQFGAPEPGYDAWFRAQVQEALDDDSPGIPHEEAMRYLHDAIKSARRLKASA